MKRNEVSNTRLAETPSLLAGMTTELKLVIKLHEEKEQTFYNMGFTDAKDSVKIVVS